MDYRPKCGPGTGIRDGERGFVLGGMHCSSSGAAQIIASSALTAKIQTQHEVLPTIGMQDHSAAWVSVDALGVVSEVAGRFTRVVVAETARREMAAKWRRLSQPPIHRNDVFACSMLSNSNFRFESFAIGKKFHTGIEIGNIKWPRLPSTVRQLFFLIRVRQQI
jgi:hypothetical protein